MSRRRIGVSVAVLTGAMLLGVGYVGWSAWRARAALLDARDSAKHLEQALRDEDLGTARTALTDLQQEADAARSRTDGPAWWFLERLPVLGDDADAIATLSAAIDTVATDGLPGLVDSAAGVIDGSALTPHEGRFDLNTVTALRQPVEVATEALAQARDELAGVDQGELLEPVRDPFAQAESQLADAADALRSARRAIAVLPSMLGNDGERTYLLIFQNNSEIRATGGLPGAVSVVTTDHGTVHLTQQRGGNTLGHTTAPVLPLSRFERTYYGPQLGTYFLDANLTPDFPRAADLWRAWWLRDTGQRIDGIIAIDPVALSYLLEAAGPLSIRGDTLTADNAVAALLHETYLRFRDPADQDAYFAEVASKVFDLVMRGSGSTRAELEALSRAASEGRLLVHSFTPAEQAQISGTPLAGELWTAGDGPRIDVALNDATAAKMQYFLRYDLDVESTCVDGRQHYAATMTLESDTPPKVGQLPGYVTGAGYGGTTIGYQTVLIDIFGPAQGQVGTVAQDGHSLALFGSVERGRRVVQVPVELAPDEKVTLTWSMVASEAQAGDTTVRVTPGVSPETRSSVVASACVGVERGGADS